MAIYSLVSSENSTCRPFVSGIWVCMMLARMGAQKAKEATMFGYRLEHICSYSARLQNPPEVMGPVGEGIRVNFYVTGGEVSGPKIKGIIRPVGGDWLTIRTDGVGILDVRATIETHDQALVYISYSGVGELGEDGYQNFLQGILPPRVQLRVAPRFQSSHPAYKWLNRLQCVNIGGPRAV